MPDLQYHQIGNLSGVDAIVAGFAEQACEEHSIEMHHSRRTRQPIAPGSLRFPAGTTQD